MAFLIDRLENIHNSDIPKRDRNIKIIEELRNEVPNPEKVGVTEFINKIKSIEYSYKLFVKKHSEYKENFFRDMICGDKDGDDKETRELHHKFRKALNW